MRLPVKITRLPQLTASTLDLYRRVLHGSGQRIASRLLQRSQVYRRLEQRARGTSRIQRTVESRITHLAAADQGGHFPGIKSCHHRCALQLATGIELVHDRGSAAFNLALQDRIKTGKDTKPQRGEILFPVLLAQLPAHQAQVCRERAPNVALVVQPQWHGPGHHGVFIRNHALLRHHIQHHIAPLQRSLGVAQGIVQRGALDHANQQGLLMQAQLLHRRIKIMA